MPGTGPEQPLFFERRARQLALSAPECYAQLAAAILSAKTGQKPPEELWISLNEITSRFNVNGDNALTMVIHFFIVAEPSEAPFFICLLKKYVNDYKKRLRELSGKSASPYKKHFSGTGSETPLSREIGLCLRDVSEEMLCVETAHEAIKRLCKASAVVIYEGIISFDELWSSMGDEKLSNSYSAYKDAIDVQIHEEWLDVDPFVDEEPLNCDTTRARNDRKSYEAKQELSCPINTWLIAGLLTEKCLKHVAPYFAMYDKLTLASPLLRASLLEYFRTRFEREFTVNKFIVLCEATELLGPHLGQDVKFFAQACELCAAEYKEDKNLVLHVMQATILPALSLYKYSKAAMDAVWMVLVKLRQSERFKLYREWRDNTYDQAPALKVPKVVTKHKVEALMQRLSDGTIDSAGKSIILLATSNPLLVWEEVLRQLLKDDKLMPLVLKFTVSYSDPLVLDTLLFTILDTLETKERPFFKKDGVSFEQWFKSLSLFTGSLFAQSVYLQGSSLVSYLDMLADQVSSRATHVSLLSDLLTCMSGISPLKNLSDAHIKALGGSSMLRKEILRPTTTDTIEDLAAVKKEMSETDSNENLFLDQTSLTDVRGLVSHTFSLSLDCLLSALGLKSLVPRLLTKLATSTAMTDISFNKLISWFDRRDRKTVLLKQLLEILRLGEFERLKIFKSIPQGMMIVFAPIFEFIRPSIRAQIDFRSSHFLDDCVRVFPRQKCSDPKLYALFWTLEAYDVYVPVQEYLGEISRIKCLKNDNLSSTMFNMTRSRVIDSLEASLAEHVAHVNLVSSQLPKLENPETVSMLREMVLPRSRWSQTDAHYAFCFLSQTLSDPGPVLEALFDWKLLVEYIIHSTGEGNIGLAHFVSEMYRDVRSWVDKGHRGSFAEKDEKNDDYAVRSRDYTWQSGQAEGKSPVSRGSNISNKDFKYTLFRDGVEIDSNLRHCEENLFKALSEVLSCRANNVLENALNFMIYLGESFPRQYEMGRALMDDYLAPLIEDKMRTRVANLAKSLNEIYIKRQVHWDGYAEWKAEHQMQTKDSEKIEGSAGGQLAHGTAGNKAISEEKPFTRGDPAKVRPLKRSNVTQRNGTKRQCKTEVF